MTWARADVALPCPLCGARTGARCRTSTGKRTTGPHLARQAPRYLCLSCGAIESNPHNVAAGFCAACGAGAVAPGLPVQPVLWGP